MGLQRPGRQEIIKDRLRIQGGMGQLDAFVASRRAPLGDLLAIGVGQLLAGPFKRTPSRVVEPFLAQRPDDPRLVITLQTDLRPGNHPQTVIRERPVADHIAQHQHALHAQRLRLREHRLQRRPVAMDVGENREH